MGNSKEIGGDFTFDGVIHDEGGSNKCNFDKIGSCKMTVSGEWTNSGTVKVSGGELFIKSGYDHNIVFTHPANAPTIRQLTTLDLTLRHSTLRLGYLCTIRQGKLNHLRQHQWARSFMIGWCKTL